MANVLTAFPYGDCLLVRTKDQLQGALKDFPGAVGLEIASTKPSQVVLSGDVEALIITSANAVPAAKGWDLPVYAVGEKTKEICEKNGLEVVMFGTGNAEDLAKSMVSTHLPHDHFAHIHGDTADLKWHQILREEGMTLESHQGYTTNWETCLSPFHQEALKGDRLKYCLLFSAHAAENLISLLNRANIPPHKFTAVCISDRVAQAAKAFGHTVVAEHMNSASMQQVVREKRT